MDTLKAFAAGETLELGIAAANAGSPIQVDAYLGVILADEATMAFVIDLETGELAFGSLEQPQSYEPLVQSVMLPAGLDVAFPEVLTYEFPPFLAEGEYDAFAALTIPGAFEDGTIDPGDILSLEFMSFEFSVGEP